ncbi:Translation initiation factor IF-2, mitochondrial [Eufriesea mexicana]|nr:Translation initiation factor IF-2, mitochondrial [Eufriesea mexicana]
MTVKELAICTNKSVNDIFDVIYLNTNERVCNENSIIKSKVLSQIVKYLGKCVKFIPEKSKDENTIYNVTRRPPADESQLVKRHPVVTIMGHVDHGKTTLLDALRNTSVAQSEFGGITQCISAFNVTLKSGKRITFFDTPGHAAFISMRNRGVCITDIVVLVVAANDGVKEQTLQSIKMANDANVPIIVAINKIDKPNIDINETQNELEKHGIVIEERGGDTQCVKISALKRINLQELMETIVIQAELMDLKADPVGLIEAVVVECSNDYNRGKLVTALIQRGTLRKGCYLVSGAAAAKVKGIYNDSGSPVLEARPSEVVQIIGWKELPMAGDEILEVESDKILQRVIKFRKKQKNEILTKNKYKKQLEKMKEINKQLVEENSKDITKDSIPEINIIIKGDTAGSVGTLLDIFNTYTYDRICKLNIVHYDIGPVTNSDIELAEIFNAIIYGFNVNANKKIEEEASKKGLSLRFYNVIYKLIDNIKEEIFEVLPQVDIKEITGEAKVLQVFSIKDKRMKVNIAGCHCNKGTLLKSGLFNIIRNNENIYTGKVVSMRHLKEEVLSVKADFECGLRFEDPTVALQPGDTIICFTVSKGKQELKWDPGF